MGFTELLSCTPCNFPCFFILFGSYFIDFLTFFKTLKNIFYC